MLRALICLQALGCLVDLWSSRKDRSLWIFFFLVQRGGWLLFLCCVLVLRSCAAWWLRILSWLQGAAQAF